MRKLHVNQKVRICGLRELSYLKANSPGVSNFARVKRDEGNLVLVTLSNGLDWYLYKSAIMPGVINKPELEDV